MNILVTFFFLHYVVATFFLGLKFAGRKTSELRNFGIALLLNAAAFAVWSYVVMSRPENMSMLVSVGVVFFVVSLIFLLKAGIKSIPSSIRNLVMVAAVVAGVVLLYLRMSVFPSAPVITTGGFFFFNPHPIMQLLEILALSLAAFPAIDAVASKFKNANTGALVRFGFIAEVVGGIMLITSTSGSVASTSALYLSGWIIGIIYLILWTTLLFNKKAWSGSGTK